MKVSSRGEYALRALLVLAKTEEKRLPIADIAAQCLVPPTYLEQVLAKLKALGIVRSRRGTQGGYSLAMTPKDIVIGTVIRRLEGPLAPMSCVSVTAYQSCPLEPGCQLQPLWALIRDTVAQVLDNTTLLDLLEQRFQTVSVGGFTYGEGK